jgi:hypothetical protein
MSKNRLPSQVSEYIKEHFLGSFLSEVKERRDSHGHVFYDVELTHENLIYNLEFNQSGELVTKTMEEAITDEDSITDQLSPE